MHHSVSTSTGAGSLLLKTQAVDAETASTGHLFPVLTALCLKAALGPCPGLLHQLQSSEPRRTANGYFEFW